MEARGEGGGRRGPAPIASFDHDVSDESSPETKQTFQLPEIREDTSAAAPTVDRLPVAPSEARARSHSTPGLTTPAAPRIDISRASSSSHHDSRDSSPELALFAGTADAPDHLGFREDGALELRSSTEELAFLEPAPGEASGPAPVAAGSAAPPPPPTVDSRRHSRKDSQGSETALLGIMGRTSRLSSVGSQCSAQSALSAYSHASRVSRLSVVSGTSRSPSPHKMLLETSFCGPKPIETDPEICAAAVEEHLLEIVQKQVPHVLVITEPAAVTPAVVTPASAASPVPAPDARDRREVRTEVTVEPTRQPRPAPAPDPPAVAVTPPADDKREKETRNRARVEERRARSRERRDHSEPEVYKSRNRSKDVIRIKLKPDEEYGDNDDDDDEESERTLVNANARKPDSLALGAPRTSRAPSAPCTDRVTRSPSPQPQLPSRKSSFCSLFKSKETIASPDSPADAVRRKKSLNEGRSRSRSRSKSRDRTAPPSSAGKLKGSVLSLFKTPRRSAAASPSPSSRAASPGPSVVPGSIPPPPAMRGLKYYEDSRDGIIHIPLRTPPDEPEGSRTETETRETVRPASAPCARSTPAIPMQRTVLPDGSIIIPLHSPTERDPPSDTRQQVAAVIEPPPSTPLRSEVTDREPDSKVEPKKPTSEVVSPPETISPPSVTTTPLDPVELPDSTHTDRTTRSRRKERIVFMTHVGSTEQVFSTQFSITKTPSVTSEISESFPSLQEEVKSGGLLRDTHITSNPSVNTAGSLASMTSMPGGDVSPGAARDSSESEGSSETGAGSTAATGSGGARGGDAEARGLVVQESFEEELPYVPTTLPQERSCALPMLPVRERGPHTHTTASVERPRSARGSGPPLVPPPPPPAPAAAPPPHERLRIRLPRRASTATTTTTAATSRSRPRTRSGSGDGSLDTRKSEWIDFSEVPERRKVARRIQTVPAAAAGGDGGGRCGGERGGSPSPDEPPLGYVEPDQCRCECHQANSPSSLQQSSPEEMETVSGSVELVVVARPFTADLGVRDHPPAS